MGPPDSRASYLADPTIQSLTVLLREVANGLLAFPRFQRPFVWTPSQRLELVKTILKGLPIGTFMTWRTSQHVSAFETIGPWAMPKLAEADAGRQYVLDGLQRLSTLYVALTPEKKRVAGYESEGDSAPEDMWIDLSSSEIDVFERAAGSAVDDEGEERTASSIALTDLLDSRRLLRRQRILAQRPDGEDLVERSDGIAETLRNYKVPIVPFVSDDLDQVTRAFQLVNSQGTQMSQLHMVNALAWSEDFSLLETIDDLRAGALAEIGWQGVDEAVLLRCFALAVGVDSYDFEVEELASKLRKQRAAADRVATTLRVVAAVLRTACHIRSPELVPYTIQIVVLFGALKGRASLSKPQQAIVRDWLWYTSYIEAFSGSTSASLVRVAMGGLNTALEGGAFRWAHRKAQLRRFPQSVDFRHGRSRVFALRLAHDRAQVDETSRAYQLLVNGRGNALANVLPASAKGPWRAGRGARVVVGPGDLASLRSALAGRFDAKLGARHVIAEDEWTAYREGRFEEFVKSRDAELGRREQAHFDAVRKRLFGRRRA